MDNINWFEIINTGGVVAVLVLNLWMFASGKVIPKSTVDAMMKSAEDRTIKVANEIKEGIEKAVKDGIVNGVAAVRSIQENQAGN